MDADTEAAPDPIDFDKSCNDVRCDDGFWFDGEYERNVPTWHEKDPGFGLTGNPVILSVIDEQAGPEVYQPRCYVVEVMANTEEDAQLFLKVDHGDDGGQVYRENLGQLSWSVAKREFHAPSSEMPVKFSLLKKNEGDAVLYYMQVSGNFSCSSDAIWVTP